MLTRTILTSVLLVGVVSGNRLARADDAKTHERTEHFDRDPGWDGHNNRAAISRKIRQDFGYSNTAHTGGKPGELGGFITPAAEPAFYAKELPDKTFNDRLSASGTIACTGQAFHVLIGFFNVHTLNEWRTPNTIALRISGRGDVFYAWLEYATSKWRAGGDSPQGFPTEADPKTGRKRLKGFSSKGTVHKWSLTYDPEGNNGRGVITATIDDVTAICHVAEGHRGDGGGFNRFGLLNVMKSAAGGGEIWLGNLKLDGKTEDFNKDLSKGPIWYGMNNRRTYETKNIRPHFDFGYSMTRFNGGNEPGEVGGLIFRGDCRFPERMAYYGAKLEELTLDKPMRASGKISMTRGVTDSSVLFGFFHSKESMTVNPSQASGLPKNFLGISTDGPSREGFLFAPTYRMAGDGQGYGREKPPHIYPDGKPRDWSLQYSPSGAGGRGEITVTLDKQPIKLALEAAHRKTGARFDRFGFITTWVDGNAQHIYLDDITYTWKQD